MSQILGTEIQTYEQQRENLLGTSEGKFVLIHGNQVVGMFDSKMDAIAAGYQQFGNVPFLVKRVLRIDAPAIFTSLKAQVKNDTFVSA